MIPLLLVTPPLTAGATVEHIEKKFNQFVKEHKITGAALCFTSPLVKEEGHEKGHIVTFGTLSRKTSVPVNHHSFFPLGSLTQPFTALLLAHFIKNGDVSLDATAAHFLPRSMSIPSYKGSSILVGDLATNTSGLPDLSNTLWNLDNFSSSSMYRYLSNYKLEQAPGIAWEESNLGYAFLSNLIARFGKQSFPVLMDNRVLKPLKLKETFFSLKDRRARGLVIGYEKNVGISLLKSEKHYSVFLGANGLYSTPYDMLSWLNICTQKEGSKLSSLLSITLKEYFTVDGFRVALPWKVIDHPKLSSNIYLFSSSMFGYTHMMAFIPSLEIGVCFMGNLANLEKAIERLVIETLIALKKEERSIKRLPKLKQN